MLNLTPHHRLHIPNALAAVAAVSLLITSVVGFNSESEIKANGMDASPSAKVENSDNDINDAVERRRRGLNLGFLLFRRG